MKSSIAMTFASVALAAGLAAITPASAQPTSVPPAPTVLKTCASAGGQLIPCAAHPGAAYGVPYSEGDQASNGGFLGGIGQGIGAIVTAPLTLVAGTTEPMMTGRSVAVSWSPAPSAAIPPAPTEVKSCAEPGGALVPCIAHPGAAYGTPAATYDSNGGFLGGIGQGVGAIVMAPVTIASSVLPK
jgi:hypothetical protein